MDRIGTTARTWLSVMVIAVCARGCGSQSQGGGGVPDAQPVTPGPFTPSFDCLPDCYRKALESCQPTGSCTTEGTAMGTPQAEGSSYELWACFDNGVRTHVNARWMGGVLVQNLEMAQNATPCRVIESRQGPSGEFWTLKDPGGMIVASAAVTSFPGMTISCGGSEHVVDRRTNCGRTAIALLGGLGLEVERECQAGTCK